MLDEIKIIEQNNGLTAYDCNGSFYIRLKKGASASDHTHSEEETVFLMEGEAELTIGDKTQSIKAPIKLTIPPKVYHKITALTDCVGLEIKQKS